jgi:hypothetical protein
VATYQITSPDGKTYEITAPDEASEEEVLAYAQQQFSKPQAAPEAPADPTGSFVENLAAGAGRGIVNMGRGLKQRLDEGAAWLEKTVEGPSLASQVTGQHEPTSAIGKLGRALGMPTAQQAKATTQAEIDESRKLDAPLMSTAGGKIGNFVGTAAPAIVLSAIPSAIPVTNTYAMQTALGAATGAAQPTSGNESALVNTALGAAGGAVGKAVGNKLESSAKKVAGALASQKSQNAMRDSVAQKARAAGYTIPPSQTNPSMINRVLEGISGKAATGQQASKANQSITKSLVAKELNIPEVTPANVAGVRANAGKAYEAVKQQQPFDVDTQFVTDIAGIGGANRATANAFPSLRNNDVDTLLADFTGKTQFPADASVEALKQLRHNAKMHYKGAAVSGAPEKEGLAHAERQIAEALEGVMGRNLSTKAPGLYPEFQQARTNIAKAHTVEDALNEATGTVDPMVFAKQYEKGAPLSGNMETIAQVADAFPDAMKITKGSTLPLSPLDYALAGGLAGVGSYNDNPWLGALALARPGVRATILSKPYQQLMGQQSYTSAALPASRVARALLPSTPVLTQIEQQ